jgi:hypothetical protein
MKKDWRDPRDGTTWVIRIWESSTVPTAGPTMPRVISFRRQAAFEVYSTGLEQTASVHSFTDEALQSLLDRARSRLAEAR